MDEEMAVRSPLTAINYDISTLDHETQEDVRHLFQETPAAEIPQMVLQWCQLRQEQYESQDTQVYAFQMHEIVSRSIRIGSPNSRYSSPRCEYCERDSSNPCKHLIYLLDQIDYHTSDHTPDSDHQTPVSAMELGNPFDKISNFHLDLLAGCLHCDVGSPDSKTRPSPVRLFEAREVLATMGGEDPEAYRPDIFDDRDAILQDDGIISYDDLTRTVTNMLLTNNEFFAYFLKLLEPTSKARDPYRKLQQHVDRVLAELDTYSQDPTANPSSSPSEGPRNVPWAAAHVLRAVGTITSLLQDRPDAPSLAERASAARALVLILTSIVTKWNRDIPYHPPAAAPPAAAAQMQSPAQVQNDTNLYQRLVGNNRASAFVLDALAMLPEQNHWIDALQDIQSEVGQHGAQEVFLRRLEALIARMRSNKSSSAVVIPGGGDPRSGAGAAGRRGSGPASASSASGSSSRKGGGAAAGSKRSPGGGIGREGGAKRAR